MQAQHKLPDRWSTPEIVGDVITVGGVAIERAGVVTTSPAGEPITGSAAGVGQGISARSWFELLERVSCIEATQATCELRLLRNIDGRALGVADGVSLFPPAVENAGWRHARSNGVAIHRGWKAACERAFWELVERDRILRAWHGETRPARLTPARPTSLIETLTTHAVVVREFPAPERETCDWSAGLRTVAVFAFPRSSDHTLAFGYAARPSLEAAAEAAGAEALQMLAFLLGEDVAEPPAIAGPSPSAHLDHWLWPAHHEALRAWLEDGHTHLFRPRPAEAPRASARAHAVRFVDLTPAWLGRDLTVVKAVSLFAEPLAFGSTSPFAAHLPPELRIHPIA